jgi:5-methylcytosine-specific restriction endonuclease McrA
MFSITICNDTKEILYSYDEYLKSLHWKILRQKYIETYGDKCEICDNKGEQLHHLNYDNLGNEEFDDLMLLCSSCHYANHKLNDEENNLLI